MIPETIHFTGLTIRSLDLIQGEGKKVTFTPPGYWSRVEVPHDSTFSNALSKMDKWLSEKMNGRWASHLITHGSTIVVFFEDDSDAMLFKLLGGETAWQDEIAQFL